MSPRSVQAANQVDLYPIRTKYHSRRKKAEQASIITASTAAEPDDISRSSVPAFHNELDLLLRRPKPVPQPHLTIPGITKLFLTVRKVRRPRRTRSAKRDSSTVSQKDKESAFKILISSLNTAFIHGQSLYGRQISSIDVFFDAVDRDCSGAVDRTELTAALRRLGLGLKPCHISALMEAFDEDGSGEISREEFTKTLEEAGWGKQTQVLPWQLQVASKLKASFEMGFQQISSMDDFFDAIDRDGSGGVDRAEFEIALRKLGLDLDSHHIDALMKALDDNGSGQINKKEFTKTLEWAGGGQGQKLPWQAQLEHRHRLSGISSKVPKKLW